MVTDRVGDFIIQLKNAGAVGKPVVEIAHSGHLLAIARKLKELGFVADVATDGELPKKVLKVTLAYDNGEARIRGVKRLSKPGRRLYIPHQDAHTVKGGTGVRIISSPKGIISDREAREVRSGGETLFEIW